jgi:hypothetical protein
MGEIIGIESIEEGLCSDFEETVRSEHRSDCARDVSIGISQIFMLNGKQPFRNPSGHRHRNALAGVFCIWGHDEPVRGGIQYKETDLTDGLGVESRKG